ncbi:MAG TPA: winged helix-turn-helix domain-containing protein, partial [Methanothrix soehngenii]|nr:winged helix-turn-helix domain-containing protein [Methanothrix soehngenii]
MNADLLKDVNAIKSKLDIMHEDMKRFMERSNQQHLNSIVDGCRSDFFDVIRGYATDEIESSLEGKISKDCHMKNACKALFSDLLNSSLDQIKRGEVSADSINDAKSKLEEMRRRSHYDQCKTCFSEVARLLDKQIDLMRSLRVYRENDLTGESMQSLPEEETVIELLEPLSNKQRLQILKALFAETKTFSALAELTGLRGGNLLFHLQKLQDGGMILQRHERGDYMISEKGYRALRG